MSSNPPTQRELWIMMFRESRRRNSQNLTATESENFSCRLKSMRRCHSYSLEHRHNIASAGFYLSGHDERFHCFSCGLIMPGFVLGVDPWRLHALSLTDCAYLKQVKGDDFVQQVQAENGQASPAANQPVPAETGPSSSTEIRSEASDLRYEQYLMPTVERDMTCPAVKAVRELFDIPTAQIKQRLLQIRIGNGTGYIVRVQDFNDLMLNCADHCDPASELIQPGREIRLERASYPLYAPFLKQAIDRDMRSSAVKALMAFFHIPTARIRETLLEIRFTHGTTYELKSEDFKDLIFNCDDIS